MPELSFQSQLLWEKVTIWYFFIIEFQMKTFMAQCPTVLPLCSIKSSFVLEWINLYIIRWEVIFAWWEKSALGNVLEMGMVLLPREERKGEQWNEMFYCYSAVFYSQWAVALDRSGHCMSSLQGSFGTKFSSDVIALRVLGDTVSIPAVTATPKGCGMRAWLSGKVFMNPIKNPGSWCCCLDKTAPGSTLGNASRYPLTWAHGQSWNSYSFLDLLRAWRTHDLHFSSCPAKQRQIPLLYSPSLP